MKAPYLRIRLSSQNIKLTAALIADSLLSEISKQAPGSELRLPPVRVLAHQLGVSKNTISVAYEELIARGNIFSDSKKGYFLQKQSGKKIISLQSEAPEIKIIDKEFPKVIKISTAKNAPINLGSVFIGQELLPLKKIEHCFKSVLKQPGLHYMYDTQGFEPLRKVIAKRLSLRGFDIDPDWIVTTTGSQQALDVCVRSLAQKTIATENPAYGIGKLLFEMNGMQITSLPLNPFTGVDLELWDKLLSQAKPSALYLTTNFHNPTGFSYSTHEIERIIEICKKNSIGIIEDDWGSDMLPYSEYRTPLRILGGKNVLYINSFTKKLLPSLRLGYVVGNEKNISALLTAKRVGTLGNPALIEATLFEFIDRGYFDQHLNLMQKNLEDRYQKCLQTLKAVMPDSVQWTTPGGGPLLWLELPKKINLDQLNVNLKRKNVVLDNRTKDWFFGTPHLHGIKIGFAYYAPEIMAQGLEILADCIKLQLKSF